jgi:RNA polymerase sigma-70 factor, ECF subfamily
MRSDEELVHLIREGDARAFEELYARYARRLFGYLARMIDDRAVAEDLFQEVFLEVLRKDALELREKKLAGWLFTVARNRALTHLRSSERRKNAMASFAEGVRAPAGASPEEALDRKNRIDAIARALARLSEPHQDALYLKEVGGLTYRQIAEIQSVPEGTAKSRLHTAIKTLRELVGAAGGES